MKQHFLQIAFALFTSVMIFGCQGGGPEKQALPKPTEDEDYLVTISTPQGDMKAILYEETPKHRENFVKLASEGFYDELLFHRVIPEFMVQGGDPESKNAGKNQPLGGGGPDYTLEPEFREGLIHERGALSAARRPDAVNPEKKSNGSQFFIIQGQVFTVDKLEFIFTDFQKLSEYFPKLMAIQKYAPIRKRYEEAQAQGSRQAMNEILYKSKGLVEEEFGIEIDKPLTSQQKQVYTSIGGYPPLDGEYTVFGKVIDGIATVDQIAQVKTDSRDRPLEPVVMRVSVEVLPKKEITEKYGYEYEGL